jgi:hypothetical protein
VENGDGSRPADHSPVTEGLAGDWKGALGGDAGLRAQWQVEQGGHWGWQGDGVVLTSTGTEWATLRWARCGSPTLRELRNFVIEVTVSGKAEAAGLSFGHYKDFLASLGPPRGRRELQLEVDVAAACWAFRVDGQLMGRCWWDSAVRGVEDLLDGVLALKARGVDSVSFHDLSVSTFHSSCQLSVVVTCYRFLQRLRVSLRNWCHQRLPSGAYEVLVVNPASPDGTHEHLAAVARSYPHVRVREVSVGAELATNKGAMINAALAASRGPWVWLTDADCLFAPDCAAAVMAQLPGRENRLLFGQRRHLTPAQTDALVSGRADGVRDFTALAAGASGRPPDNAPWGYTQIVHRQTFNRARYDQGLNHFAHTDGMFVQACRRRGVLPEQLDGLFCLHLDHPFAWYGTDMFL